MKYILAFVLPVLFSVQPLFAADGEKEFDVKSVVLEHFEDSYWWHVGTFGTKEVNLYLPVILHSPATGWHCFSSRNLSGGASYQGFSIASDGEYTGKVVETLADGTTVRPFDMSVTRTVAALLLNSAIVLAVVLTAARIHRRNGIKQSPGGIAALMEWAVESIEDDLIKPAVGDNWRRFAPYLLTVFFFILINNFMSLIPFFPGGVNVTGNIAVTFVLALASFIAINLFGGRAYWKDIFWPEVPTWLKVPVPFMPVIEFIGIFTKPFALMIRLFANMLAGHAAIICLVCIIFVTAGMGAFMNGTMSAVAVLFAIFMNCLEVLVAFLQAYVFTMLSGVFIGLAQEGGKDKKTISKTNNKQ